MSTRAAAAEATGDRIVEVAIEAFTTRWYEDVTLRGIARDAGVAPQTIVNHFGTKEQLFAVALDRWGGRIESSRWEAAPGDVEGALRTLVRDYERTGDAVLRLLAMEDRVEVARAPLARGRARHQEWVEHVFAPALAGRRGAARELRLYQLVVVTDVYTWKLLRRDRGLGRDRTLTAMRELVLALHDDPQGGSR